MRYACAILCGVLLAIGPARAQTAEVTQSDIGFDCWIGGEGTQIYTHYIRCIADRDLAHPELIDPQSEAVLKLLHSELHRSGADAEKAFKANIQLVREAGAVWHIRIYSYPSDSSWQEGMPERLVRAVLCPRQVHCAVTLRPR
ncbi:MAG: hypothetical protein HYY97_02735 [Rhodocyclales bacterium]|nr:hypothetical protein [Rhodocyclales bacterium]